MSAIDVSILIVYMNNARMARQTLRNIRALAPACRIEVLVMDNNVADGFVHVLRREFPEVRYFPMERNLGFGKAMNVGIREARGNAVLIFNPDLAPEHGSIDALYAKLLSDERIGIVAPQLRNPDDTLQYSVFSHITLIHPFLSRTPLGKTAWGKKRLAAFRLHHINHDAEHDVPWAMGSALMARRADLLTLQGFDERFFMYCEDADLCRRMHLSGKRVVYFPAARMIHYHRRQSADGSFVRQLCNPLAWQHFLSTLRYVKKYQHASSQHISSPPALSAPRLS